MKKHGFNYVSRDRILLYSIVFGFGVVNTVFTLSFYESIPVSIRGMLTSISAGIFTSVIMAYFVDNISSRVQYEKYKSSRNMFLGMVKDSMIYMFRLLSRTLYQISSTTAPQTYIEVLDEYTRAMEQGRDNYVDKNELVINKYLDGYRYAVTQLAKELYTFFNKKDLLILHSIVDDEQEWKLYDTLDESITAVDLESVSSVEELNDIIENMANIKGAITNIVDSVEEFKTISTLKFQKYKIIKPNALKNPDKS